MHMRGASRYCSFVPDESTKLPGPSDIRNISENTGDCFARIHLWTRNKVMGLEETDDASTMFPSLKYKSGW